jgi:hypothetical protein
LCTATATATGLCTQGNQGQICHKYRHVLDCRNSVARTTS